LAKHKNVEIILGEVVNIDRKNRRVFLRDRTVSYDYLIVAAGSQNSYFGHDDWEQYAPGLKSIEDAISIRSRIYSAFEEAEISSDPEERKRWLTFVIVGGGPTGVELAGAVGEIANITLKHEFRSIDTSEAKILLIEGGDRILPSFPESLARAAAKTLDHLNIEIRTGAMVFNVNEFGVDVEEGDERYHIDTETIMWGAGVKPSGLGKILVGEENSMLDKFGRILVEPDLTLPDDASVFVIGDLANFSHQTGEPLPGLAPVAMSQGRYAAKAIINRITGKHVKNYRYFNRGNLAVIGRAAAVADFGWLRVAGYPAWLLWIFVHIMYLVEFDNRLLVFIQFAWNYFTRNRGARLITYDIKKK
jgi:NADH dehydrogenase